MDDTHAKAVKDSIHARLRRLVPGAAPGLRAMVRASGDITTQAAEIVAELAAHWGRVFRAQPIDESLLVQWLEESLPTDQRRPPSSPALWRVRRKDVVHAIRSSGKSMAGPDRIPYEAWR